MPKILNDKNKIADDKDTSTYINLFVRSRNKVLFHDKAHSITSVNQTGVFDILPMHANFISLVTKYIVIDKSLPTEKKIDLESAVISVIGANVDVYVGI